jgi:hypothetical protein
MVFSSFFGGSKKAGFSVGDESLPRPPKTDEEVLALCIKIAQSLVKRLPTEQDVYWFVVEQYDRLFEQGDKVREILANSSLFEIEHRGCRSETSYVGKPNPGVVFLEQEVMPPLIDAYGKEAAQRIGATIYVLFCDGLKLEIRRLRAKYASHYHNNCVAKGHYNNADEWALVLSAVGARDSASPLPEKKVDDEHRTKSQASAAVHPKWVGNPLTMKLDCGRQVELTDLGYSRTYAGLLEGRTSQRLNASILKRIEAKHSGARGTYFIPPVLDESDPSQPVLPCVEMHARLTCHDSINGNSCGSLLMVSWLTDECHHQPLSDVVFRAVRGLRWDELASDFDY